MMKFSVLTISILVFVIHCSSIGNSAAKLLPNSSNFQHEGDLSEMPYPTVSPGSPIFRRNVSYIKNGPNIIPKSSGLNESDTSTMPKSGIFSNNVFNRIKTYLHRLPYWDSSIPSLLFGGRGRLKPNKNRQRNSTNRDNDNTEVLGFKNHSQKVNLNNSYSSSEIPVSQIDLGKINSSEKVLHQSVGTSRFGERLYNGLISFTGDILESFCSIYFHIVGFFNSQEANDIHRKENSSFKNQTYDSKLNQSVRTYKEDTSVHFEDENSNYSIGISPSGTNGTSTLFSVMDHSTHSMSFYVDRNVSTPVMYVSGYGDNKTEEKFEKKRNVKKSNQRLFREDLLHLNPCYSEFINSSGTFYYYDVLRVFKYIHGYSGWDDLKPLLKKEEQTSSINTTSHMNSTYKEKYFQDEISPTIIKSNLSETTTVNYYCSDSVYNHSSPPSNMNDEQNQDKKLPDPISTNISDQLFGITSKVKHDNNSEVFSTEKSSIIDKIIEDYNGGRSSALNSQFKYKNGAEKDNQYGIKYGNVYADPDIDLK